MRVVFNDFQTVFGGNLHDTRHVAGVSGIVNDKDGARLGRDSFFDFRRGDVKVIIPVHIGKDGRRAT